MSVSTFEEIIERVTSYLIDIMPAVIQFPNSLEEKQEVAAEFAAVSHTIIATPGM